MAQIPTVRLLILSLLAACGGGGSDEPGNPSQFSLSLSDAPVDNAQKVCIAIAGLRLNDDSGTEQASWSVLDLLPADHQDGCLPNGYTLPTSSNGAPRFLYLDLLHYQQGDSFALLSNTPLAAGSYGQLRLRRSKMDAAIRSARVQAAPTPAPMWSMPTATRYRWRCRAAS